MRAAKGVVPVYIDCKDTQHKTLVKAWKAFDLPMLGFTTWDGARIEEYEGAKDAASIAARVADVAARHRRDLPWTETLDKALEAARKGETPRLIAVAIADKPEHTEPLRDPALWPHVRDFLWVRVKPDSDEAKRLGATDAPAVVVLDADAKPLRRLDPAKPVKELASALEDFHKSRRK